MVSPLGVADRDYLLGGSFRVSSEGVITCPAGQPLCVVSIAVGPGYVDASGSPQTDGCHAIFPGLGLDIQKGAAPWIVLQLAKDDPADTRNYSFDPSQPFVLSTGNDPLKDIGDRKFFPGNKDVYLVRDLNKRKRERDPATPGTGLAWLTFDFYVVSDDGTPVYSADPKIVNRG